MGSGIDFWQFVGGLRRENVGENLGRSPRVWRKYQNFKTEDAFLVDLGFLTVWKYEVARLRLMTLLRTSAIFIALAVPSYAVFPFDFGDDGTGTRQSSDFTGNWVGDGTAQSGLDPGTFSGAGSTGLTVETAVEDFTSGTGSIFTNVSGSRVNSDLALDVSATVLGGGTADLEFANSGNFDGGNSLFNSVDFSGFQGNVTSISITLDYNQFVGGRDNVNASFTSRPFLGALGLASAGTGLMREDFNVSLTLVDPVFTSTPNGTDFAPGLGGATAFGTAGFDGATAETNGFSILGSMGDPNTFTASEFTGEISLGASSPDFLLFRGFDDDGNGFDGDDATQVFASEVVWTISVDDPLTQSFASDTRFTISLDGEQFANVSAIPEPSLGGILLLSFAGGLFIRRRK